MSKSKEASGDISPSSTTDEIGGREAAEILRVPYPGTFNRLRRRLQRISAVGAGEKIARVPELGGFKYPGCEWIYSRRACVGFVAKYRDGRRTSQLENDG